MTNKNLNTLSISNHTNNNDNALFSSDSELSDLSQFKDMVIESDPDAVIGLKDYNLPEYTRVRVVGKGSFGVAILYRRTDSNILVVLKQINLSELSESERELAMNEADVFSKLHHPNVISYLGNFTRGDTLIIEMEYADGGTLAQIITEATPDKYLEETKILKIFEQITSAINYMHLENILHRDLKTANIFLNSKGIVKIGDFGISKIINTKIHAQTVLGTPYYFSPEMCEGKEYDEKSDIWALGCILGETCCLKKAFTATNLSELVTKIMLGQYILLPEHYSKDTKRLVDVLLQVDPSKRPSATEILNYWLPMIYQGAMESSVLGPEIIESKVEDAADESSEEEIVERSVMYQLKSFGSNTSVIPLQLPPLAKIIQVATSGAHFITVSEEGFVYTWGEGNKGQLGHGSVTSWKHYPTRVDGLKRYTIVGACAGDGFSIFCSNLGVVLSCGDNSKGCLGHGNHSTYLTPKVINDFVDIEIINVSCGTNHVIAMSRESDIFCWGYSNSGALGLGKQLLKTTSPMMVEIIFGTNEKIKSLHCGSDCSVILMKNGDLMACGSNVDNRIGFGIANSKVFKFTPVTAINKKVTNVSLGANYSAFIVEGGYVLTLGDNTHGQRGLGHTSRVIQPTLVTGIKERYISNVQCYSTYAVVHSDDNIISLWGTRHGIPESNSNESSVSNAVDLFDTANSTTNFTNFLASVSKMEKIFDPIDILALYSSPEQILKGHFLKIENVYPLHQSILVLVSTTAPLATHA